MNTKDNCILKVKVKDHDKATTKQENSEQTVENSVTELPQNPSSPAKRN